MSISSVPVSTAATNWSADSSRRRNTWAPSATLREVVGDRVAAVRKDVVVPDDVFYGDAAGGIFGRLLDLLNRLDAAHVYYKLDHTRPDSVMIDISLPGWRWEVEFMSDGSLDIERYQSTEGVVNDAALIEQIFISL